MSAIRLGTAANVRGFQELLNGLSQTSHALDHEALQDEFGRLRVWSGNLGALQKGHSSLDYRLRDSPLLSNNVLKLLRELEENLTAALAIVSGARLPYEQQPKPEKEDEEDDDFFSEDGDDNSDTAGPRTELEMRFGEIRDIIDNLYKISVRIRQPTIKSRSLKAASYQPKDPETGVDILDQYAAFDLQHTQELVRHLRTVHASLAQAGEAQHDGGILVNRLARAVTLRRRQFKYWSRHREKLGVSTLLEDPPAHPPLERPELPHNDTLEAQPEFPILKVLREAPSQKTGKTLLSGTEVTHHHQSLDEIVDSKSVTSYATTVRDLTGKGIELPPPPKAADGEKDFECPYCFIICPARYGRGRPWKTHLLQDLQPYICTYEECELPDQLFRSRKEWIQHEAGHRKAWRCPEHPTAVYKSKDGLRAHLQQHHGDSFPESQLDSIVNVGETSTVDTRPICPICYAQANMEGMNFQNHLANHLERIAVFALPANSDNDGDYASSRASRGRTDSSGSQDIDDVPLLSDEDGDEEIENMGQDTRTVPSQALSEELLRGLPDARQERLNILFSSKRTENEELKDVGADGTPTKADENVARTEDKPSLKFRLFPREDKADKSKSHQPKSDSDEIESESDSFASSGPSYSEYETDEETPMLSSHQIPTIRSLYRSGILLQRDHTYAPNDTYNQIISFGRSNILLLNVDAIVNSTNRSMKMTKNTTTLNHSVHKAAGPMLQKETRGLSKMRSGQAILTKGYQLPSANIIHAATPHHLDEKGMRQYKLSECYRNTLALAMMNGLKTVAFPLLGAGGNGFPARVAVRVALREVRDFLDKYPGHSFEKIIFVAYNDVEEKAFMDFLPVFFPPTHGDIENAVPSGSNPKLGSHARLGAQLIIAHDKVEAVVRDLSDFVEHKVDFPSGHRALDVLVRILPVLRSLMEALLEPEEPIINLQYRAPANLQQICNVMDAVCSSITGLIELGKEKAMSGQPNYEVIWESYSSHMKTRQGLGLIQLLELCQEFAQCLENTLVMDAEEPFEMGSMSLRLRRWLLEQTGKGYQSVRSQLDEMYMRQFQQSENIPTRTDVVKSHQLQSIARLYQVGELEQAQTLAIPSTRINDIVGLVREDITRLEVDIIVNSTDATFAGIGLLDKTIQLKGGVDLMEECASFGTCEEGTVKVTRGYLLPARHILHVVAPMEYHSSAKDVLRKIYREILHTAVSLKATSIAIPAIGAGMLSYPARDSASLAMEEVKGFLESMEFTSIEKIVFVVFTSKDENIYKSLLPVYFPPIDLDVNKALPRHGVSPFQSIDVLASSKLSDPPRRAFSFMDELFRGVKSGKQPVAPTKRPLEAAEKNALDRFERHARGCSMCIDIQKAFQVGHLCADGHAAAQNVLQYLYMEADSSVYSTNLDDERRARVEIPSEFPLSRILLMTVEKSSRDENRNRSFVGPNKPWQGLAEEKQSTGNIPPGVTLHNAEITTPREPDKAFASVRLWPEDSLFWKPLQPHEASIHIFPGKLRVYATEHRTETQTPLLSLELTPLVRIYSFGTSEVIIAKARTFEEAVIQSSDHVMLKCRGPADRRMLFKRLLRAAKNNPTYMEHQSVQQPSETQHTEPSESDVPSIQMRDSKDARRTSPFAPEEAGESRNLRSRIFPPTAASISLQSPASESPHSTDLPNSTLLLCRKILVHLETLQQPITGLHQRQLAEVLDADVKEVAIAAEHLKALGLVHTVFGSNETWVVRSKSNVDIAHARQPSFREFRDTKQEEAEEWSESERELSPKLGPSEDVDLLSSGVEDLDIAKQPQRPAQSQHGAQDSTPGDAAAREIDLSISGLSTINIDDYYTFLDAPTSASSPLSDPSISQIPSSSLSSLSPGTGPSQPSSQPLEPRWTKLDRRLVNPQALEESNEDFEEKDDSLIVKRKLSTSEIVWFAQRTREIRRGKGEWVDVAVAEKP